MVKKNIEIFLFAFIFWISLIIINFVGFILSIINFKNKKNKKDSVIFLEVLPVENAGYQYRSKKWVEIFNENNIKAEVKTLISDKAFFDKYIKNKNLSRFFIKTIWIRFSQCLHARKFKTVIVRRELLLFNDYGNLFMEKFLLKIHNNVILDFDDDIAASKREPRKISRFGKLLKENPSKFTETLKIYKRFIAGSRYLKEMVLLNNKEISEEKICIIPTCVDYDNYPAKKYDNNKLSKELVFGWLGGNYNLFYLDMIIEPLNKLSVNNNIKLIVVSGEDFVSDKANFPIENQRWTFEKEKEQIKQFDIGLMPINNDLIDKGKCGFKLIQYMGMGVVSIATNVTINGEIINDNENGFLVKYDNSDWDNVLRKVFDRINDFPVIGENARQTIMDRYSFSTNKTVYLDFITNKN